MKISLFPAILVVTPQPQTDDQQQVVKLFERVPVFDKMRVRAHLRLYACFLIFFRQLKFLK